jgi:hypothetical protein
VDRLELTTRFFYGGTSRGRIHEGSGKGEITRGIDEPRTFLIQGPQEKTNDPVPVEFWYPMRNCEEKANLRSNWSRCSRIWNQEGTRR